MHRDVLPALDAASVRCYFVTIGTPERGLEFVEKTGFPPERLLMDPENLTYDALGFKKGIGKTFLSAATPQAIWARIQRGGMDDLKAVLSEFSKTPLWHPPRPEQALQQGGVVAFRGADLAWAHYDPATSAHADLALVVRVAGELAAAAARA